MTSNSGLATMTRFSLIIPVYMNEQFVDALVARNERLSKALDRELECIFVVDGSPDESYMRLKRILPQARFPSRLVVLSRNFGSFAAIRMGLSVARGPYFAMMAADLQEPEELVLDFFRALATNDWDVVVGERLTRDDPWQSVVASQTFWFLYRKFVQREVPRGGIDMFGCTLVVRDTLLRLEESHSTLVGLLLWLGFRRKTIGYRRLPRQFGRSAWSFRRKVEYLLDSTFAFSDLPIRILLWIGGFGIVLSSFVGVLVFFLRLVGAIEVPGYAPIMLAIAFSSTLILFSLGILGGYTWRAFENTKRRPLHVAMIDVAFPGKTEQHNRAAGPEDSESQTCPAD